MADCVGSVYLTEEQILPAQSAKKQNADTHWNNEYTVIQNWAHVVMDIIILLLFGPKKPGLRFTKLFY